MTTQIRQQLASALRDVDVHVVSDAEGARVTLAHEEETYHSSSFSAEEAEAIQQFLRRLRRRAVSLRGRREEVFQTCRRQYPNVPEAAVRTVVDRALNEAWTDARLKEALTRTSLTQVLQNYKEAHMWGVLVMAQRDQTVCPACARRDNVAYQIDHALQEEPLPHPGCDNLTCRCQYLPVVDEADLYPRVEKRTGA